MAQLSSSLILFSWPLGTAVTQYCAVVIYITRINVSLESSVVSLLFLIVRPNQWLKEILPPLVRDLFTFSSKVIKSFIIV
jgi:hypothetical protein